MIDNLLLGFQVSLSFSNLVLCFVGCVLGTIIGLLPGLGPVATMAMLLPITYKLNLTGALIMLAGIWYGAQYGGTITSVLLKIPGEVTSIVTVIDGYQMALQGRAGKALGIAAFGSFVAGTIGIIGISLVAPPLVKFALKFGPPEYAALMTLGMTLVIYFGSGSMLKALLMGAVGLALGTVGLDKVTNVERFTFGSMSLIEGINIGTMAMGLFGIGEILSMAENEKARSLRDAVECPRTLRELLPDKEDWKASIKPILRATPLGFFLGILPGGGTVISTFASYAIEKRLSKTPERFGKGAIEGVAGPESANNAGAMGAFIPLLTLGIPTNAVLALLFAAFILHGLVPGPLILKNYPEVFWGIITSMYIGNAMLLVLNIPLIRVFVKILEIPFAILSPLIVLICAIGAYSLNNDGMDVVLMMIFGCVAYLMKKFGYELVPLLMAFVLGPFLEKAARQSLVLSHGSPLIFFARPISAVMIVAAILLLVWPIFRVLLRRQRGASILEQIKGATKQGD